MKIFTLKTNFLGYQVINCLNNEFWPDHNINFFFSQDIPNICGPGNQNLLVLADMLLNICFLSFSSLSLSFFFFFFASRYLELRRIKGNQSPTMIIFSCSQLLMITYGSGITRLVIPLLNMILFYEHVIEMKVLNPVTVLFGPKRQHCFPSFERPYKF